MVTVNLDLAPIRVDILYRLFLLGGQDSRNT